MVAFMTSEQIYNLNSVYLQSLFYLLGSLLFPVNSKLEYGKDQLFIKINKRTINKLQRVSTLWSGNHRIADDSIYNHDWKIQPEKFYHQNISCCKCCLSEIQCIVDTPMKNNSYMQRKYRIIYGRFIRGCIAEHFSTENF